MSVRQADAVTAKSVVTVPSKVTGGISDNN